MDTNDTNARAIAPANPVLSPEIAAQWAGLESEAGPDTDPVAEHQAQQQRTEQEAADAAKEAGEREYKEALEAILVPGFAVLAPNWNITGGDVETLAAAYAPLLQKYWPGGIEKVGPELGAAFATVAILGPRLRTPRKLPAPEAEEAPRQVSPSEPSEGDDVEVPAAAMAGGA